MKERRLLTINISRNYLEMLPKVDTIITTDGFVLKIRGIPEGAKIVGMDYDIMHDGLIMVLEHDSFPECPEGAMVNPAMYEVEMKNSHLIRVLPR